MIKSNKHTLSNDNMVRKISAESSEVEVKLAKAYIQGAVHSYCSNNTNNRKLSVRILFGGNNGNWENTPLQCIYDYHKDIKQSKNPANDAAKDVGWLFKSVLLSDKRTFKHIGKDTGNIYEYIE